MFEKLFDSPGAIIKSLAKAFFLIEAACFIVAGLVFILTENTLILGISLILGGIPGSYLTNLLVYAFGDLVENTKTNRNINAQILAKLNEKAAVKVPIEVAKKAAAPVAVPAVEVKKPVEPVPAAQPVKAKPVREDQPCSAVLTYALQFSTTDGMRSHIERRLKFCEDPASISVYQKILENSDENLRSAIEKYLNS